MPERTYEGYLQCNWKTGDMKFRKTSPDPGDLGYWIPVHVVIQLVIPESEPEIRTRIELPEAKVVEIVTEVLKE